MVEDFRARYGPDELAEYPDPNPNVAVEVTLE
jgi:hypothetical protein